MTRRKLNRSGERVGSFAGATMWGQVVAAVAQDMRSELWVPLALNNGSGSGSGEDSVSEEHVRAAVGAALDLELQWAVWQMGRDVLRKVRLTGLGTFGPMMKRVNRRAAKKTERQVCIAHEMLRREAEDSWAVLDELEKQGAPAERVVKVAGPAMEGATSFSITLGPDSFGHRAFPPYAHG